MILTKDLFVLVEYIGDVQIWKDALFTSDEADKEIERAKLETGKTYFKQNLEDYFTDLFYSWY